MEYSREKYMCVALEKAYSFGFLYPKEVVFLQTLAWSIKEKNPVIVNIGAGAGTSTLAYREARKDAKIITIDISAGGPHGGLQNEINAFKMAGYTIDGKSHVQILGNSKEVSSQITDKIDMLFIDGDHSYPGCYDDLALYYPLVKNGGIIAVHDYCSENWGDVTKAVDDFFREYKAIMIGHIDTVIAFRK